MLGYSWSKGRLSKNQSLSDIRAGHPLRPEIKWKMDKLLLHIIFISNFHQHVSSGTWVSFVCQIPCKLFTESTQS
jgi:hypothetical protein